MTQRLDVESAGLEEETRLLLGGRVRRFIGPKGVRYFQILYRNYGGIPLAVRLNADRKGLPVHPVHFREGMQIRNFLRRQPECAEWSDHDFDDRWIDVLCAAIDRDPKMAASPRRAL